MIFSEGQILQTENKNLKKKSKISLFLTIIPMIHSTPVLKYQQKLKSCQMVRVLVRFPKTSMAQCMVTLPCAKLLWHQTARTWKYPYFGMDTGRVVPVNTLAGPWMPLSCPSRVAPCWLGTASHLGAFGLLLTQGQSPGLQAGGRVPWGPERHP